MSIIDDSYPTPVSGDKASSIPKIDPEGLMADIAWNYRRVGRLSDGEINDGTRTHYHLRKEDDFLLIDDIEPNTKVDNSRRKLVVFLEPDSNDRFDVLGNDPELAKTLILRGIEDEREITLPGEHSITIRTTLNYQAGNTRRMYRGSDRNPQVVDESTEIQMFLGDSEVPRFHSIDADHLNRTELNEQPITIEVGYEGEEETANAAVYTRLTMLDGTPSWMRRYVYIDTEGKYGRQQGKVYEADDSYLPAEYEAQVNRGEISPKEDEFLEKIYQESGIAVPDQEIMNLAGERIPYDYGKK